MYRILLNQKLSLTIKNVDLKDFDMREVICKTDRVLSAFPKYNSVLLGYQTGFCYYNGKISHRIELTKTEQRLTDELDELIRKIEPMNRPLYLFHGFEAGLYYGDSKWKLGDEIEFNFHLSKTPAIWVASRFTNHFGWYLGQNNKINKDTLPECYKLTFFAAFLTLFYQKYLFCIYDEVYGSHAASEIRAPAKLLKTMPRLIEREEFEYLSHRNEKFLLCDVVYKFSFRPPFIRKFYIMKRI